MTDKSWIAGFIESEFVRAVESMDDIIASGRIKTMSDEEVTEAVDKDSVIVDRLQLLAEAFASGPYMHDALFGGKKTPKIDGLYERHEEAFDAMLLYGHDGHNATYNAGVVTHMGEKLPRVGYGFLHNVRNTAFTMAFLVSGDERHLIGLDQTASLEAIAGFGDRAKVEFDGNSSSYDNSIYTILFNLVKNAESHGARRIKIGLSNSEPQYRVTDNGRGIPHDKLPLIFGDYSTTGGGLGLRVARRILDLRGGHISVDSTTKGNPTYRFNTNSNGVRKIKQQEVGTTFSIYLPR